MMTPSFPNNDLKPIIFNSFAQCRVKVMVVYFKAQKAPRLKVPASPWMTLSKSSLILCRGKNGTFDGFCGFNSSIIVCLFSPCKPKIHETMLYNYSTIYGSWTRILFPSMFVSLNGFEFVGYTKINFEHVAVVLPI